MTRYHAHTKNKQTHSDTNLIVFFVAVSYGLTGLCVVYTTHSASHHSLVTAVKYTHIKYFLTNRMLQPT